MKTKIVIAAIEDKKMVFLDSEGNITKELQKAKGFSSFCDAFAAIHTTDNPVGLFTALLENN